MKVLCSLIFVSFFFGGCVSAEPVARDSTKWRMQRLESAFLEFQEQNREEKQWREQKLADLQDRLDHVSYMLRREIGSRTPVNASKVFDAQNNTISQSKNEENREASTKNKKQIKNDSEKHDPEQNDEPQKSKNSPKEMKVRKDYQQGLQTLESGKAGLAREKFRKFLQNYPRHELAANAYYWLAETYYSQQKFAQSILSFKEVIERFPEHHKAADSLLKIGYAYININDLDNARFYLTVLIDDYPDSAAAQKAKQKLKSIKDS